MDITLDAWLRSVGHVAHTTSARTAGFSKHRIAVDVAAGRVQRVRRSWLVTAECPPELRTAAAVGGRLTCVSAAARAGLWVPEVPTAPHVAVPPDAAHTRPDADATTCVLHWSSPPVPLPRTQTREHPLNVLFHTARCLPRVDALAVWESALRGRIVDPDVLMHVAWRSTAARELAEVAAVLSDSGVETRFVALMRSIGVTVRQQVWIDGHPLDGLIGERLAIQIDGFAFHQARDRRRDLRADARLALRGYTPLRFDYQQVLFDSAHVIDTVQTALAQGLHLPLAARRGIPSC